MFLLPLAVIAIAAIVFYRVLHREVPVATGTAEHAAAMPVHRSAFWPTSIEGKIGIVAFVLGFAPVALVNVIQVAFLGWALQLTALASTAVARLVRHDRSTSVLVVLVLAAISALAGLLFLAGEIFIGHE